MTRYCTKCGATNDEFAQFCSSCQSPLSPVSGYQPMQSVNPQAMTDWKAMGADKKIAAGIVAILLGSLGVHKFILGYTTEGIILLLVTVLTCGLGAMVTSIIGIVEGIIYLTKSDEEFVRTYIQGKKGWF
jgi:TM2 domain-containing membrane protein YozV